MESADRHIVLVHVGKDLPVHIYDCLYQALVVSTCNIYVLIDHNCINIAKNRLSKWNIKTDRVAFVPLCALHPVMPDGGYIRDYSLYATKLDANRANFRDNFWISTMSRFWYISAFMKLFCIDNVVHIENDNLLYMDPNKVSFPESQSCIGIVMDSDTRVIPSIVWIPNRVVVSDFSSWLYSKATDGKLDCDMFAIAEYHNKQKLNTIPEYGTVFDGAAIGQYLGGIDPRNTTAPSTVGFINETSDLKPNRYRWIQVSSEGHTGDIPVLRLFKGLRKDCPNPVPIDIVNLHIHSKKLYQFSSVFDIKDTDIISGDRVLCLCDIIITTPSIVKFHSSLRLKKSTRVIAIPENAFGTVNSDTIGGVIGSGREGSGPRNPNRRFDRSTFVKIGLYGDIVLSFVTLLLPRLVFPKGTTVKYYIHNSDKAFGSGAERDLLNHPNTEIVYAQNPAVTHPKLDILPIGIANKMWPHGDIDTLYSVMVDTFKQRKELSLYTNINPDTYSYRRDVLDYLQKECKIKNGDNLGYCEYLQLLSKHRYSLCIRGNGIDTHRFWESLYSGVTPIVIDNSVTQISSFVEYIRALGLPIIVVSELTQLKKFCTESEGALGESRPVKTHSALKLSKFFM